MMVCLCLALIASSAPIEYPVTPARPVYEQLHGTTQVDPYRWLEDAADKEVQDWSTKQNALARSYLDGLSILAPLKARLTELEHYEARKFVEVSDASTRFIWLKKADDERWRFGLETADGDFHELLNPNEWKQETLEFATPSRDGSLIAFGVSQNGNELPTIRILDVATGRLLQDELYGRKQGWPWGSVHWLPDNSGFYYGAHPESGNETDYWHAVYLHKIGSSENPRVFHHPEVKEYFHDVAVSDDGSWLVLTRRSSSEGSEIFLQRRGEESVISLVQGFRTHASAVFAGPKLLLVTDENAPNYQAYLIDPERPERKHWKLLIAESNDRLSDVVPAGGIFYAHYLRKASTVIHGFNELGEKVSTIPLPTLCTAQVSGFWHKSDIGVDVAGFTRVNERYRWLPTENKLALVFAPKIHFSPEDFVTEQQVYVSRDGTPVTLFLVRHKDCPTTLRPTLLTGYGGFGIPITPTYSSQYIPFLEAGGMLAIPNLRGGGEYGEGWHAGGQRENKQNVFDDFIGAAEWLIAQGITRPHLLAIRGRSNGGLLVGAALVQRPDLFCAVSCEVPLLDMLRFHRFGFSSIWCVEYGNPESARDFEYLARYSPYHGVKNGVQYPAVLIRGAENDARTDALHARKMIARLQAADPTGASKLLLVDGESGHLGGTTTSSQVRQKAETMAFIMDHLGLYP